MIANLITSEKSSRSCQSASSGVTRILIRPLVEILSGSFFQDILSGVCFSAAQPFGLFGASQRNDDLYYWLAYFPAVSTFSHIFGYGACTSVPNWWRPLVRFSTLRFLVSFSKGFARNKKKTEKETKHRPSSKELRMICLEIHCFLGSKFQMKAGALPACCVRLIFGWINADF